MLEYDRIDISEGIKVNKNKNISRKCSLCKFYYFLDKNFNYGPYLCNGCYDVFKSNKYAKFSYCLSWWKCLSRYFCIYEQKRCI